eukprot:scaffold34.g4506.t1
MEAPCPSQPPEVLHDWSALPLPALAAVACHLTSRQAARGFSLVCTAWHAALAVPETWICWLHDEVGYSPASDEERAAAQRLLVAAHTSQLALSGANVLGLPAAHVGRFTAPEPAVLLPVADRGSAFAPLAAAPPGSALRIKEVAAGADWAVLLTWCGGAVDTRCCSTSGSGAGTPRGAAALELGGLWRPPSARAVAVAAGGCWRGPGRAGGHALVLASDGSVWGWGGNMTGELGAGSAADWAPVPVEATDAVASAAMGRVVALACGDTHSALLTARGSIYTAGCNQHGQCGQPVVLLRCAEFRAAALPGAGARAARLASGGATTAVATAGGRLLVCGDNSCGQCGTGSAGGALFALTDAGPSAAWHGMQRRDQLAGGGGGCAACAVAGVAVGGSTVFALTDAGELFGMGSGSQGELGVGGTPARVCTPSKLPWARGIAAVAASSGGRFAAAIDDAGRTFTWGANKCGALAHGDTAKRAVGRHCKGLVQRRSARSVACGADFLLLVTTWRPGGGRGGGRAGGSLASPRSTAAVADEALPPNPSSSPGASPRFAYQKVDAPPPSPRRRQHQQPLGSTSPRTPRRSEGDACSSAGGSSSGLGERGEGEEDEDEGSSAPPLEGSACPRTGRGGGAGRRRAWEPPGQDPDEVVGRRQRWMAEPPAAPSSFSEPEGEEGEGEGRDSRRQQRAFRGLVRRQLKAFCSAPAQRDLAFPASLSPADRHRIHVLCEAWGLMHQSVGAPPQRRLLVWKPSRARRSLKPEMLQRHGIEADDAAAAVGGAGAGGSARASTAPDGGTHDTGGDADRSEAAIAAAREQQQQRGARADEDAEAAEYTAAADRLASRLLSARGVA